jgi:hypothetical protein
MKRIFLSLAGFATLFGLIATPVQSRMLSTDTLQTQAQPEAKSFTGRIVKSGENFVLSDSATKSRYMLDSQDKARPPRIAWRASGGTQRRESSTFGENTGLRPTCLWSEVPNTTDELRA